jgi:hypothetical protein
MRRHTLWHWLVLGALGASVTSGCSSTASSRTMVAAGPAVAPAITGSPYVPTHNMGSQAPRSVVVVGEAPQAPAAQAPAAQAPVAQAPAVQMPVVQMQVAQAPVVQMPVMQPQSVPVVSGCTSCPSATVGAPVMVQGEPPVGGEAVAAPQVVVVQSSPAQLSFEPAPAQAEARIVFPRAEPTASRKSFVDLTASPCFAHAPDYNWIIGQVEYSRIAKEWRLRYASVDETDRFGGRVVLIENHHVTLLHDGQYVHVRGHLVDPEVPTGAPANYRIESFRTIENPNAAEVPADE